MGSGFLISSDGFVLTNTHVIENAEEVIVTLSDGTDHEADIVGIDEVSDIALLKIDACPESNSAPAIPNGGSYVG